MGKLIAWCRGHGENTYRETGAKGVPGMAEFEFNTAVVSYAIPLAEFNGFRTLDVQPAQGRDKPLKHRTSEANAAKADFYFSVHADANANKDARGHWGAYWHTAKDSKRFAEIWQKHADAILPNTDPKRRIFPSTPGTWSEYAVCRDTAMPAFLGEHGFMTNKGDLALLKTEAFRKLCAEVAVRALCEYFGMTFKKPVDEKPVATGKTPILGEQKASVEQMVEFVLAKNPTPKISVPIENLCRMFLEEGEVEGIRGDIAFCQSMHETGWLKYGGQVLPEQNNYAGIGATNNSPTGAGAWFKTAREGVRAQIHHLKAYGSKTKPQEPIMSPRYHIVEQVHGLGSAPTFEDLGGKWAVPGYNPKSYPSFSQAYAAKATYGQSIMALYNELIKVEVPKLVIVPEPAPVPEPTYLLDKEDANMVIGFLQAGWSVSRDPEFGRLADELRKASGQPTQN
jgi:hypothetical protein